MHSSKGDVYNDRTMPKTKHTISQQERQQPSAESRPNHAPAAPTYFRAYLINTRVREMMAEAIAKFRPPASPEEQEVERLVQAATTPLELVRLAGGVKGAVEGEWSKKLEAHGSVVVPIIAQRLKRSQSISDERVRTKTIDNLVGALRWQGEAGAQALLECFNNLDDYGQSLACVVLGLMHVAGAGDAIWRYYQRIRALEETYVVGAMWGLADLQDARAADAVDDQWKIRAVLYELFGFTALCGDARLVVPLVSMCVVARNDQEREAPFMAFAAVVQRVGREVSLAQLIEMRGITDAQRDVMAMIVDKSLQLSKRALRARLICITRKERPVLRIKRGWISRIQWGDWQ